MTPMTSIWDEKVCKFWFNSDLFPNACLKADMFPNAGLISVYIYKWVFNFVCTQDTAKYLFNLDPESAHYDPKTRAMRENPFEEKGLAARDLPYAGDNFVRWSGDAHEMARNQMFSWEAYEKGTEAHLQVRVSLSLNRIAFLFNQNWLTH